MKRRHLHSILIPIVGVLLAAGSLVAFQAPRAERAAAAGAAVCRYEEAAGLPSWITTGAWRNRDLLVVDVVNRELVQISKRAVGTEMTTALGDYLEGSNVTRIRPGALKADGKEQFVVEFAGGKLLDVDRGLTPRGKIELSTTSLQSGENRIAMLIDWILAGDEVVGYADIQGPGEGRNSWKNGFVRFKLDRPQSFSITRERMFPDDARVGMTLTYPLMATIGRTAYVALVDDHMRLWRFGPQDQELLPMDAFPAHLNKLAPMLPSWAEAEEFPETMKAVELSTMPAGLWSWNGSLYLLSRTVKNGQREWYLSKINPIQDQLLWTVRVPSSAHHLTVIPGPDEWAFLEKGPVTSWLNQTTHHIRFVSAAQMRSTKPLKSLCN